MGAQSNSLEERLQAEFSPPLDSTLIAAIVADYLPNPLTKLTSQQLGALRQTLIELAAQADKDEDTLAEQFSELSFRPATYTTTDDTNSANDIFSVDTTTTTTTTSSNTSDATSNSQQLFSSPIGFLQAAFPELPTSRLKSALNSMGDIDDIDMEAVVDYILSMEYVRDLEERGLDALDDSGATGENNTSWQTVEAKKTQNGKQPKKQKRGVTMTLGDVRQKQLARPNTAPSSPHPSGEQLDPWTQVSSIAAQLAALLSPHPASYFQSKFHDPKYATPSAAIRVALSDISPTKDPPMDLLFNICGLLASSEEYQSLSDVERDQLMNDASLALCATRGSPDETLDIVWLLRGLDSDSTSRKYEWGLYHSPPSASPIITSNAAAKKPALTVKLPSGPSSIPLPLKQRSTPLSSVSPSAWQTIPPIRRSATLNTHPHAEFIPAYNGARGKKGKVRGAGNGLGKGGKGDVGELMKDENQEHRMRAGELMDMRREALKEASRAWQRGNTRTRGGEVAWYYAEQARQLQEQARRERLVVARGMVQANRAYSNNGDSIDLHGLTVIEAIQVVKGILNESIPSPGKPLKIITGRGRHSTNGIGVLSPAIRANLVEEGWDVSTWEAGLVIRGRISRRL